MKAKAHAVWIGQDLYLIEAQTRAVAISGVVEILAAKMRKEARCDLVTGEQLYEAGKRGTEVLNSGKYKCAVDPNQLGLTADELP